MTQGKSLHIGLNRVDPAHYEGWSGVLRACEADARAMKAIADAKGFDSTLLLNEQATAAAVIKSITDAAQQLQTGDILFLSYSGHGGQVPDTNSDEIDGADETWALYDRMLIDDELYGLWAKFQTGVRIFMLSDSCHSGTMARVYASSPVVRDAYAETKAERGAGDDAEVVFRVVPLDVERRTYEAHQDTYDRLQRENPDADRVVVSASVLLISGCQDLQTSADGLRNGLFTATLLSVWNNGAFHGSYRSLYNKIRHLMPKIQEPNYFTAGARNRAFEREEPFKVAAAKSTTEATSAKGTRQQMVTDSESRPDAAR